VNCLEPGKLHTLKIELLGLTGLYLSRNMVKLRKTYNMLLAMYEYLWFLGGIDAVGDMVTVVFLNDCFCAFVLNVHHLMQLIQQTSKECVQHNTQWTSYQYFG